MKVKILNLFLLLAFNIGLSQSNIIEINNEMFKWRFSIPNYFENVSPSEAIKNLELGKKMIEKSLDQEIVNKSVKIYGFKNGDYNQLIVNYQLTKLTDNYSETFKEVSEMMCNSFKEQLPLAEITSSLSSEIISNVKFEVFDLKISSKNKIMFLKSYSTIRFNKILNVQIGYTDADKGQALISSFKNSIFTE